MLESALELADYSSKSADSSAYSPKIGVWVWAFSLVFLVFPIIYKKKTTVEMPGIEPGAFHMQSERSTTELHPLVH